MSSPRFVRNELPHESYLELASFYVRLNLHGEGREVLLLAPKAAHGGPGGWGTSAGRMGRQEEIQSVCWNPRCGRKAPRFVFPHRHEDVQVLLWAPGKRCKTGSSATISHCCRGVLGDPGMLKSISQECGDSPDFASFYLARAGFPGQIGPNLRFAGLQACACCRT